ncbi:MAG: hypothetical protein K2H46_01390 [Muribaculaceae bacterium]|nr:hypothetical protein [Muribaculaceae bacterium]
MLGAIAGVSHNHPEGIKGMYRLLNGSLCLSYSQMDCKGMREKANA